MAGHYFDLGYYLILRHAVTTLKYYFDLGYSLVQYHAVDYYLVL